MSDGVATAEVKRTHQRRAGVFVSIAQSEAIRRRIVIINLLKMQKLPN